MVLNKLISFNGHMHHSHIWVAQLVESLDVLSNLICISPLLLIGDSSNIETHIKNDSRYRSGARGSAVDVYLHSFFIDAIVKSIGCFHDAF